MVRVWVTYGDGGSWVSHFCGTFSEAVAHYLDEGATAVELYYWSNAT
jgi:hypothetical protein